MDAAMAVGALQLEGGSAQPPKQERRHKSLMSQVNARIDAATKGEADAAFAHAGLAPSEAIRALYARAAALGSSLRSVSDLVVGASEDVEVQDSRMAAFERATHAFDDMLARYGFVVDDKAFALLTEEEVEEAFYQDYLADGAL
jgi:antitoxin component of RelBE/YafQ-DinJ toxin-antitoxin module